jgi:hypothetical protein
VPELFDRERRLELELPLRVTGSDDAGAGFEESAVTLNVSGAALCFESVRRLEVGQSLDLEVTIPEGLRRHFGGERLFRTRSVVYRVEPASEGRLRVVARFVGHPS